MQLRLNNVISTRFQDIEEEEISYFNRLDNYFASLLSPLTLLLSYQLFIYFLMV